MKITRKLLLSSLSAAGTLTAGVILFGGAVNMFLLPHNIVTGGATGIATVLFSKFGIPVGLGIMSVNLPLFAFCIREGGISGMLFTLVGTAAASAATDILSFLPTASDDILLSALLGGSVMGIGTGLLLSLGFTTGGSDLAAHLINRRRPSLSVGRMVMIFDGIIIVVAGAALGELSGIMYSVLCTVTFSLSLDLVRVYSRRAKAIFIISDKHAEISEKISIHMGRGVTLFYGEGFFTGRRRPTLLCVVEKREEFPLRRLVLHTDPSSFMIVIDASSVVGVGFEGD